MIIHSIIQRLGAAETLNLNRLYNLKKKIKLKMIVDVILCYIYIIRVLYYLLEKSITSGSADVNVTLLNISFHRSFPFGCLTFVGNAYVLCQ